MEPTALQTANFIDKINEMWDLMNTADINAKGAKKPTCAATLSARQKRLEALREWIDGWQFQDSRGTIRRTLPVKEGLLRTLEGMAHLTAYLIRVEGFEYVRSRRMNQDHVENMFCQLRLGHGNLNTHPEAWQAVALLRIASVAVALPSSGRANCQPDGDHCLTIPRSDIPKPQSKMGK